jgi:hypothetical protein
METKNYCAAIRNKKLEKKSNCATVTAPVSKNALLENRPVDLTAGKTSANKKCVEYTWIIKRSLRKMSTVSNAIARYNITPIKNARRIMGMVIAKQNSPNAT